MTPFSVPELVLWPKVRKRKRHINIRESSGHRPGASKALRGTNRVLLLLLKSRKTDRKAHFCRDTGRVSQGHPTVQGDFGNFVCVFSCVPCLLPKKEVCSGTGSRAMISFINPFSPLPIFLVTTQAQKSINLNWGGGLPHSTLRVGGKKFEKKFDMSLEAQGKKTFWRDIPVPEKFENTNICKFCVQCLAAIVSAFLSCQNRILKNGLFGEGAGTNSQILSTPPPIPNKIGVHGTKVWAVCHILGCVCHILCEIFFRS